LNYPPDCTSSESTLEKNPFEAANINSGEAVPIAYRSPDIDYNATAGTVTVNTAGNYFVYFAPMFSTSNSSGSSFLSVFNILKNGSDIFTTTGMRIFTEQDPAQVVCHTVVALAAGDEITSTFNSSSGSIPIGTVAGTTLILLRMTGHFAAARNTADGSATSNTGNLKTFDDVGNPGVGTVATNTNGVTFDDNGGEFFATAERLFINLQTLMISVGGATSNIQNRLTLDNSTSEHGFMDIMMGGSTSSGSPINHTQQILKAIPANLDAVPTVKESSSGVSLTLKKGTCFSLLDVGNQGSVPSSFLNIVITSDGSSSSLGTTEINIYDDDNYGTLTTVDPNDETNKAIAGTDPDAGGPADCVDSTIGGNRGITYSPTNGTFTFSESGDYLIMSNLGVDAVTSNENGCFHHIKKNNTDIAFAFFFMRSNRDPVTNLLTTIAPFEKDDVLTVTARRNSGTAHVQDGTSIIIVRLGPVQTAAPGFNQLFDGGSNGTGQPIVQTDDTINSADKGDQRDRRTEQSPFRMTVNGPLTLRGRARSSLPFSVGAGKRGDEK